MTVYLVDEANADIAMEYASVDTEAHVVLLQDGIYAALAGKVSGQSYALKDDVERRGLKDRIPSAVSVIGYSDLVAMMEKERVVNFL